MEAGTKAGTQTGMQTGTQTHLRTCPLCEAMCGLRIETSGDRVVGVRGDPDDVWSKGYLCPKGASLAELHHDPDRLRAPMVREGDQWREVSWDEAFARCEELIRPILDEDGIRAITAYIGNPAVHNYSLSRYTGAVAGIPRMPVIWSAGTVDQWPKNLACARAVRQPVEHPDPGRPADRPVRGDGRQSRGVTGLAVLLPGHPRRDEGDPGARRPHDRGRSAPDRDGGQGRRVDPDRAGDGRGLPARDRARARCRRAGEPRLARGPGAWRR